MKKNNISIIVAIAKNGVIGLGKKIPWHIPEELQAFKQTTINHNVIMGRKTYESIGKILPERTNYVISKSMKQAGYQGLEIRSGFGEIMFDLIEKQNEQFFIIGGKSIYDLFLPLASRLIISEIDLDVEGDTCFPAISLDNWVLISEIPIKNEQNITVIMKTYERDFE